MKKLSLKNEQNNKVTTNDVEKELSFLKDKDNLIRLAKMGWTENEISKAFGISKAEVELLLK